MDDKINLFKKLIKKQKDDVDEDEKLTIKDLKRLCKYIDSNIFNKKKCCIWKGYVTNSNRNDKTQFINFYFKGKRKIIHRILYANFIDKIDDNEYIKLTYNNRSCCNVNHIVKFKFKYLLPIMKSCYTLRECATPAKKEKKRNAKPSIITREEQANLRLEFD